MTNRITPNDWEDLSAYLDNQLSAHERADLERRLKRSPELRQALAELDRVRATIRTQPRMRAPRNFTLTHQMAGIHPGKKRGAVMLPSAYPVLRLASVLATLFFIVVSAGSLYVRMYGPAPREVSSVMLQNAQWAEGRGGGDINVVPALPAPMEASRTITEAEATSAAGAAALEIQQQTPVLEVTALATAVAAEDTASTPAPLANAQEPAFGKEPPQPGQPAPLAAQGAEQTEAQAKSNTWRLAWIVLVGVQVLLAILAIATGAAAIYLRRSVRR